jgi:hypothetical protein
MARRSRKAATPSVSSNPEPSGSSNSERAAPGVGTLDVCAMLALVILLLHVDETWWVRLSLTALAISGLLFPSIRLRWEVWLVAALVVLAGDLANWESADNHKFLIGYWCLAFACALRAERRVETLATAARWMIALAFGLAVFWKLSSGDYLDGSFFSYELLIDPRFANVARLFGAVTPDVLAANAAARASLTAWDGTLTSVALEVPGALRPAVLFLTWWTLAIEIAIALSFALAPRLRAAWWRNGLLLLFVAAVYAIAPVIGFGSVLTAMGYAQCREDERRWRIAYLLGFMLLQAYRASWSVLNDAVVRVLQA